MKKLRLNPDELAVESFDLPEADLPGGTVHARNTHAEDFTCGCAESEGCTYDPRAIDCVSYAAQCPLTENNGWTCGGSGCTQIYDYTCGIQC